MKQVLVILLLISTSNSYATQSAESIMKRVEARPQGQDFSSTITMNIHRSASNQKSRKMMWWGYRQGSKDYLLMKYLEPSSLKGSGMLLKSESAGDNEQWIYLSRAAKKEPRRVASSDRGKPFMGSNYAYVDFERFRAVDFSYQLQSKTGQQAVVAMTPKDRSFPYSKIISKVDLKRDVVMESQFYVGGQATKIYRVLDLKRISGIWTVTRSEMKDLKSGGKSEILIDSINYNKGIKSSLFNKNSLKR